MPEQLLMPIGDSWRQSSTRQWFEVVDPATSDTIGSVPEADEADIEDAVEWAEQAWPLWAGLSPGERARCLLEVADAVEAHADELAMVDSRGTGNPVVAMRGDVAKAVETVRYMCGLANELKGQTLPLQPGMLDYTLRQPFGVVARIIPFNHPLLFAVAKLAAPLVAGNTVVLKPSPVGCASPLAFMRAIEGILPAGVVNVVTGAGPCSGRALVRHPRIKRIAFTGGVGTARSIMRDASEGGIKEFSLELGGKNAFIAFPDVSVPDAASAAVRGMNLNVTLGQSCGSTSRVFVHSNIYDEFVETVVAEIQELQPGIPTHDDTQIGCLSSGAQLERVERYVAAGIADGAALVLGGRRPDADPFLRGCFYLPTVFTDVKPDMRIAQEEIFGPVLSVLRWDDVDDMIAQVDGVSFGLTANVWTNDVNHAHRLAQQLQVGYVWVNAPAPYNMIGAPFGGWKESGIGRESSLDELLSYSQIKNVSIWMQPS